MILQPLLHTIVVLVELAMVARLIAGYNRFYKSSPGICSILEALGRHC